MPLCWLSRRGRLFRFFKVIGMFWWSFFSPIEKGEKGDFSGRADFPALCEIPKPSEGFTGDFPKLTFLIIKFYLDKSQSSV
jgi:hypothetical protein